MRVKVILIALAALPALLLGPTGCETMNEHKVATGSVIGGLAGAGLGAIIGNQSHNPATGAVIGGLAGAALGGGIGYLLDQQEKKFRAVQGVEVEKMPAGPVAVAPPVSPDAPPPVQDRPEHLVLKMNAELLFERGSSNISQMGAQKLGEIAATLREYPDSDVIVKGFTSIEGGDALNAQLSQRRSEMVKAQLVANRIAPERITALGMGSSNPIASNDTETGRMQNRRVEIDVFPRGEVR